MNLPKELLEKIDEALVSVDDDIEERKCNGRNFQDLVSIREELTDIKLGKRQRASPELSRMIVDSMDWDQRCLRKFNEVQDLLRKYFRLRP